MAMSQDGVTILVGTTKGAFLVSGGSDRQGWTVKGPFCDGWPINHVIGDPATGRLWAGGGGEFHGAGVWRSEDSGATWQVARLTKGQIDDWAANDPQLAAMMNWTAQPLPFADQFSQIWSLGYAHGTLYAGTKPARLLSSGDGGKSLARSSRFARSSIRRKLESRRGRIGIAYDIVRSSERQKALGRDFGGRRLCDGGWRQDLGPSQPTIQPGAQLRTGPSRGTARGEIGHCVHNMMRAPGTADLLYQQNHHGVWRSADGGRSWDDITRGLPSTFGFPICVHPRDPETIWTMPLNGDIAGRFPPDAAAAVWRSRDGGATWQAMRDGLPQEACYFTVLRQAMARDEREPVGLYFGTNSGSVFASADEGESWHEIARHLPTILSVEALDRR